MGKEREEKTDRQTETEIETERQRETETETDRQKRDEKYCIRVCDGVYFEFEDKIPLLNLDLIY